jgi:hypothetical protein
MAGNYRKSSRKNADGSDLHNKWDKQGFPLLNLHGSVIQSWIFPTGSRHVAAL